MNAAAIATDRHRPPSAAEFAADRLVHVLGLVFAVIGAVTLIATTAATGGAARLATVATYSAGLLAMISFSAAYNLLPGSRWSGLLRRFDHAAIFAMIAGTYTPFTILGLSGAWAIGMTALVWAIAASGVALKLLLPPRRFEGITVALYLVFGWIGLVAIQPLVASLGPAVLILIGIGGVVYSLGVIFHAWQRLPYQNAIWHAFVLAAAAIHYAAVCGVVFGRGA